MDVRHDSRPDFAIHPMPVLLGVRMQLHRDLVADVKHDVRLRWVVHQPLVAELTCLRHSLQYQASLAALLLLASHEEHREEADQTHKRVGLDGDVRQLDERNGGRDEAGTDDLKCLLRALVHPAGQRVLDPVRLRQADERAIVKVLDDEVFIQQAALQRPLPQHVRLEHLQIRVREHRQGLGRGRAALIADGPFLQDGADHIDRVVGALRWQATHAGFRNLKVGAEACHQLPAFAHASARTCDAVAAFGTGRDVPFLVRCVRIQEAGLVRRTGGSRAHR
mmetsp:Transcript_17180/g.48292  ORF Transcript_17180/g.48292 Transcript_17180/m.48292 type:complete len:279 (-) Transcript_17180:204-1040(-)